VEDAVTVALEGRPDEALGLVVLSSSRRVGADSARRERPLFQLTNPCGEAVGDSPSKLGHPVQRSRRPGGPPRRGPPGRGRYGQCAIRYWASAIRIAATVLSIALPACACTSLTKAAY